jgi:hypothetical protein|tara:strand:- start:4011 stop:4550 length:540 start_codon:yes stop_codon:yes gene_type:complete
MAFTRFHDDPCRIKKQLQESSGPGRYMMNKPGWGDSPCFMDDPHVRMSEWGANLRTNTTNLESDLMGLTRQLTKDCDNKNNFMKHEAKSEPIKYSSCNPFTEQSRVTNPAWWYRDLEQANWSILPLDPQENTCIPFQNNLDTRILEKDNFVAKAPHIPSYNGSISPSAQTSQSTTATTV